MKLFVVIVICVVAEMSVAMPPSATRPISSETESLSESEPERSERNRTNSQQPQTVVNVAQVSGAVRQDPLPGAVAPVPAFSAPGAATCLGLLPPPNSILRYSMNDPVGPFNTGSTATVVCNNGGVPAGLTTTTSCQNGAWVPSPLLLASCTASTRVGGLTTLSLFLLDDHPSTSSYKYLNVYV